MFTLECWYRCQCQCRDDWFPDGFYRFFGDKLLCQTFKWLLLNYFRSLMKNFKNKDLLCRSVQFSPLRKIPKFHLFSWCGNFVKRYSFCRVLADTPKPMWKLSLSTKFPHQETRCNFGILQSAALLKQQNLELHEQC